MIDAGTTEMTDGTVRLREVTPADADALYRWRMDARARPMFRATDPVPFETHLSFLDRYFQPGNRDHWFVIEAGGTQVGTITLYNRSADGRDAEWGRLVVDPAQQGRGYARRALALLIAHARGLGLRTLRCEVLEGNDAAAGLYRRAGFAATGVQAAGDRRFAQLALSLEP